MARTTSVPRDRKSFDQETKSLIADAATKGKTSVILGGRELTFEDFTTMRNEAAKVLYAGGDDERGRDIVEGDGYRFRGGMVRLTDAVINAASEVQEDHTLVLHVTDAERASGYLVAWNEQGEHVTVSPTVRNRT